MTENKAEKLSVWLKRKWEDSENLGGLYNDEVSDIIPKVEALEVAEAELNQIKDYMGVGYPIFKKALEDCIKGKGVK